MAETVTSWLTAGFDGATADILLSPPEVNEQPEPSIDKGKQCCAVASVGVYV